MRLFLAQHAPRGLRASAILVIASSLIGASLALAQAPATRIVWTNKDSDPHTVTSAKGLWASDALDTDDHFARIVNKVGTFTYYCSIHPFMHGVIIVRKSAMRHAHTAREV